MKKSIVTVNIILSALALCGCTLFLLTGKVLFKGMGSFAFTLVGFFNLLYSVKAKKGKIAFCIFVFIGLFLAMIADVMLQFDFILGAIVFAMCHVFYFFAQNFLNGYRAKDIVFTLVLFIFALSVLFLFPGMNLDSLNVKAVCVIYSVIISFMTGKAVANAFSLKTAFSSVIALATVLFFFSDVCLVIYLFSGVGRVANVICLYTYFPAQIILACMIFFYKGIAKKTGGD